VLNYSNKIFEMGNPIFRQMIIKFPFASTQTVGQSRTQFYCQPKQKLKGENGKYKCECAHNAILFLKRCRLPPGFSFRPRRGLHLPANFFLISFSCGTLFPLTAGAQVAAICFQKISIK